jgi:ATP-dependent Clp protease ATP-binding subunit ClpX
MTPWGLVEREVFQLRDLWKTEDLFEYGVSPQFLGRFEEIVFLRDLDAPALGRILIDMPDSVFQMSRNYFRAYGVDLQITPKALELLCAKAMEQPRLGARALKQLFKTVIAPYEYEPDKLPELRPGGDGKQPIFVLDDSRVLARLRASHPDSR